MTDEPELTFHSGDGRADAICIETTGRMTAWLNRNGDFFNAGQVKFAEGWDRANIRFADVENSGRADIIWLNKYTGAGRVFTNDGFKGLGQGGGGSSFSWSNRGVLYSGVDRGENLVSRPTGEHGDVMLTCRSTSPTSEERAEPTFTRSWTPGPTRRRRT